jgi:SAM-dependent methyltransferase
MGGDSTPDDELLDFYSSRYSEALRLQRPYNRLEFLRTQELLRSRLPSPPARILDVGGGVGVHAAWLAADGYDVELVDVVPDHVRQARELAAALPQPFTARVGDARTLEAPPASVDVCLLLGPLYHLPDPSDRASALAEAARVTRPGGIVIAAAISRYAWPLYELRDGGSLLDEEQSIVTTLATGRHDAKHGFTTAYCHRPSELADELREAGLADIEVRGIEGPGWILFGPDLEEERVADLVDAAARAARLYDDQPEMTPASAHLLAWGRR